MLLLSQIALAQPSGEIKETIQQTYLTADSVFTRIESGLRKGEVENFSEFLNNKTYISLSNGKTGYFSSNQIYYIFEDFFDAFKPFGFSYSTVRAGSQKPFASGTLKFISVGKHKSAKVFISLNRVMGSWKISQLTIN